MFDIILDCYIITIVISILNKKIFLFTYNIKFILIFNLIYIKYINIKTFK